MKTGSRNPHPLTQTAASAVFVFVAGYAVWSPFDPLWEPLLDVVGGPALLALVGAVCVVLGYGFARVTGVEPTYFSAGASSRTPSVCGASVRS